MNLFIIFLTGLTVGGLTCLAVQGGLLASVIAVREKEAVNHPKRRALYATTAFVLAKLIAYTILGFILGAFGGALNISESVQISMQLLAGIYMILVALNLLNIHPIFRYVIIQSPRFLTRLVRNQSKSKDVFAPALLGVMTIFIPCGTTLAMETLAMSSANAFSGAAILASFTLGTIPLFFGIGFITSFLGETFRALFLRVAAIAVIYLGVISISGAFTAMGYPLSWSLLSAPFTSFQSAPSQTLESSTTQTPEIRITSHGYSPSVIRVREGEKVELTVTSKDAYSCALAFRIPSLGISKNFSPNETHIFTFTPNKTGEIQFSCSMGMYTGVIEVL